MSGNTQIRQNTNDPKVWQLLEKDGVTPLDLSAVTDAEVVLSDAVTGVRTLFKISDVPSKVAITDAVNGKITFSPDVVDFTLSARYNFFIVLIDNSGNRKGVPEGYDYTFTVWPDYS